MLYFNLFKKNWTKLFQICYEWASFVLLVFLHIKVDKLAWQTKLENAQVDL